MRNEVILMNFNTDNLDYNGSYESDLAKLTQNNCLSH